LEKSDKQKILSTPSLLQKEMNTHLLEAIKKIFFWHTPSTFQAFVINLLPKELFPSRPSITREEEGIYFVRRGKEFFFTRSPRYLNEGIKKGHAQKIHPPRFLGGSPR
jgi:hypothetical protein